MAALTSYSAYLDTPVGSTGTGLDQLLGWIARDPGLAGAIEASSIRAGLAAVDGLNALLVEGLRAIGAWSKDVLTAADIVALNAWVRDPAHPERLAHFTSLHGDDENGEETGYHTIQNDGGNRLFDGRTLIDTVLDGIYHFGFPISADGTRLTNEDGNDNALLTDVARWLTSLKVDLATTNSALDRIVETIVGDAGLQAKIPWADIRGGATAANQLDGLILQGIAALKLAGAADADATRLSADELRWINAWIRSDAARYAQFVAWHGDDENGSETGFHLVQNDGATTRLFGQNAVNTIYDGIYHIGFTINADGRFQNEDGDANALVSDVAEWISYYYGDFSTTGSGLDRMVDWIQVDPGLSRWTAAADINNGLTAANSLNQLFLEAVKATAVNLDGWISRFDLREINRWVRANRYDDFVLLHGDDEDGIETGFHLIQNDGATTQFFGQNLVNTVADGIYHYGFEIQGENFLNEDGNNNQSLSDVSGWLNYFLSDRRLTVGTWNADSFVGNDEAEQVLAYGGNDVIDAGGGSDLLDGSWGRDILRGGTGADLLDGGFDDDSLDGGEDGDTYLVSGADPENPDWQTYSFQGYDTYADSGSQGVDVILAQGFGAVDIGFRGFGPSSGIERIVNATDGGAPVRLLGNWETNVLDFSQVQLVGGNFSIDAGDGCDTVLGTAAADDIRGGGGDDALDGGGGGDTYRVRGFDPEWVEGRPYTFEGFDSLVDSGAAGDGIDRIVAEGVGPVDVGLQNFGPQNGIEQIVNATSTEVRLIGNWTANVYDFSATALIGGTFLIDSGWGEDTVRGTAQADRIRGGGDNDLLDGRGGGDLYEVSGHDPDNPNSATYDFEGFDTYADSGASGDGVDSIVAVGAGPVDIGFLNVDAGSGIERIVNSTQVDDGNGGVTTAQVGLVGNWESNRLDFSAVALIGGNFRIDGGWGADTIVGTALADRIRGGGDNDLLKGGAGDDSYEVSGRDPANPDWKTYSFEGYDSYLDASGYDRIVAVAANGSDGVDIGLLSFGPASGIELIDATGTSGKVRLLGDWQDNMLDVSATELRGTNLSIELGDGSDTFTGSAAAETVSGGYGNDRISGRGGDDSISAGGGDDALDGGEGSDTYVVSGLESGGWKTFGGLDTYSDSGSTGLDRIVAVGNDDVDIGLAGGNFLANAGIEQIVNSTQKTINGVPTAGRVRLMGNWDNNTLNFGGMSFVGGGIRIDAGDGADTVTGSTSADLILGGRGNDSLNGAGGADTYEVGGTLASGFQGYDTWADKGNGAGEIDRIVATAGSAAVDIGMKAFSAAATGIERIDATTTSGAVRLLGDASANTLNFSGVTLVGSNLRIESAEGNDTVTGSAAADTILAGLGVDTINGGEGNDTISGGGGLDSLTGGNGADTFIYTTLTDGIVGGTTSAPTFEKIIGFSVGNDRFDVTTTPASGGFKNLGAASALTVSGITSLLSATNFVASGAATFTYGSGTGLRTFIAFNNATAGFSATTDALLEITGYGYASGFSSLSQISIV